ncbi:MAG: DUF2231 domain-containing protein [Nocardioidaceae bacterium]
MFNEFNGLPLHPLAIHAAVVFVPLAALAGLVFAVPRWRRRAWIPLGVLSVVALGSLVVARESGFALKHTLVTKVGLGGSILDQVNKHEQLANQLFYIFLGYTVVALAAVWWTWRSRSEPARPVAEVRERARSQKGQTGLPLDLVATGLAVVLVIGAVVVGVWTFRVGDAGAKAVWGYVNTPPTG